MARSLPNAFGKLLHWLNLTGRRDSTRRPAGGRRRRAACEPLEERRLLASLNLNGTVLNFTLDDNIAASMSVSGNSLTFTTAAGSITADTNAQAAPYGFTSGGASSTGQFAGIDPAVTQINILGGGGVETFTIDTLDSAIPGLNINALVENVVLNCSAIATQDIATNTINIASPNVRLATDVAIDTNNATHDGLVWLFGALNATTPNVETFTVDSGAGTLTLNQIGNTTALGGLGIATDNALSLAQTVRVGGTTTLSAGAANDITLNNPSDDLGTVVVASGNQVTLRDVNSIAWGNMSVAGDLSVTAGGAITNMAGAVVAVGGNAALAGASIDLGGQAGDSVDFGGLTFTATGNVSVAEDSGTTLVGNSSAARLVLTSSAQIDNAAAVQLTVTNAASFSGSQIRLGLGAGDAMNFGSLMFSAAGNVSIAENSDTRLTGVSTASNLTLISVGNLTNTANANLTVTGNAAFSGTSIDLGNQSGDAMNFGGLAFNSAGSVLIFEDSATLLAGNSTAAPLSLTSAGAITNAANANLTVTGTAALSATSIDLGNQAGDVMSIGSLTLNSAGSASLLLESDAVLTGNSTVDSLRLASPSGMISNDATANVAVANLGSFSGSVIDLGQAPGDAMAFGSLTFNSAGNVSIGEDSGTLVVGNSTADYLTLASTGSITNAANANLTIGNMVLTGTSIDLGNQAGDYVKSYHLTFNSGGAVTIWSDFHVTLDNASTAGSLVLECGMEIINDAKANLTVTGNAAFLGPHVDLGRQSGDVMNFGAVYFNTVGAALNEDSDILLTGAWADIIDLSSTGAITNTPGAVLSVGAMHLQGASVDLDVQVGDPTFTTLDVDFNSGNQVAIATISDILLVGDSTAGSLTLTATGSITNLANATLTVSGNAVITGTSIDLGNQSGDAIDIARLTFTCGNAVVLGLDGQTQLVGASTAATLSLTSTGNVTNAANASLVVAGNAMLGGTSIALGDQSGDLVNFGNVTLQGNGSVLLVEDSDMALIGDSTAGSADLTATGTLTNAANATVTVAGNAAFRGTTILLGNQAGDWMDFGTLSLFGTAGDDYFSVTDRSATTEGVVNWPNGNTATPACQVRYDALQTLSLSTGEGNDHVLFQMNTQSATRLIVDGGGNGPTGIRDGVKIVGTSQADQMIVNGLPMMGVFDPTTGTFHLRYDQEVGYAQTAVHYGPTATNWTPILGDWDGDGVQTLGLYDPVASIFYLRNSITDGYADLKIRYGAPGAHWLPIVGHWNGAGADTIGLYDPATQTFYLKDANTPGYADRKFVLSGVGAGLKPLAGDWDGDGTTTIGVYDPTTSIFSLRNSNTAGGADVAFKYGPGGAGWTPMAGDWDGDGRTTIGLYNPANSGFYVKNTLAGGYADAVLNYGPAGAGWMPVMRDWTPRFQIRNVESLQMFGQGGNDLLVNNSTASSLLDGGSGNDRLFGGSAVDVLFGGAGVDSLYGRGSGDYLFPDFGYEGSTIAPPLDAGKVGIGYGDVGESLDGGRQFDTAIASDDTVDLDGEGGVTIGAHNQMSVTDWLMAQFVSPTTSNVNAAFQAALSVPATQAFSFTGSPLLASETAAPGALAESLTTAQLQPIVAEALARWNALGLPADAARAMATAEIRIADLPDGMLGLASDGTITIDRDAAGLGWFVDATPAADEEFTPRRSAGWLSAIDPRAVDRIDLLSVVQHELGHLAGLADLEAGLPSIMSGRLSVGTRQLPRPADVDAMFSHWN